MSEASLQLTIRKGLQRQFKRSFWFKVHGGPYQRAGIPDLLGCVKGHFFALEVKLPGNKATKLQRAVINLIRRAGGFATVIYTKAEAIEFVQTSLDEAETSNPRSSRKRRNSSIRRTKNR